MRLRVSIALIGISGIATAAVAQQPQPVAEENAAEDVAAVSAGGAQTQAAVDAVLSAQRVIPARQTQATGPVYVVSPVIQPTETQAVQPGTQIVYAYQFQQPSTIYVQGMPVAGAYPQTHGVTYAYPGAQVALPPGAQLVTFDHLAWIAECRRRLGIDLRDPSAAPALPDECESYLDDYMASAAAGQLQPQPAAYGQQYMLVPVTVTIPQQAVYREVE